MAFIIAFNQPTIFTARERIVATPFIIILAYFIRRAPYVVRSVSASFHQLDNSLEEAALNLGASWHYGFWRVVIPLILPGLVAGTMLTFITAVAELSTSILLYTPDTMTIPISIYTEIYGFDLGGAAALSMIQIGLAFLALLIINITVGMKALRL
jgi:iron(III) transport system permease protein